jgi:hypothetical protein
MAAMPPVKQAKRKAKSKLSTLGSDPKKLIGRIL